MGKIVAISGDITPVAEKRLATNITPHIHKVTKINKKLSKAKLKNLPIAGR